MELWQHLLKSNMPAPQWFQYVPIKAPYLLWFDIWRQPLMADCKLLWDGVDHPWRHFSTEITKMTCITTGYPHTNRPVDVWHFLNLCWFMLYLHVFFLSFIKINCIFGCNENFVPVSTLYLFHICIFYNLAMFNTFTGHTNTAVHISVQFKIKLSIISTWIHCSFPVTFLSKVCTIVSTLLMQAGEEMAILNCIARLIDILPFMLLP